MFWQDYTSIFSRTNDLYYWYRGKQKKRIFCTCSKTFKRILKCTLIAPSYEKKYNLRLGLTRGGGKKFHFFLLHPQAKFRQLYDKETPSGIWNLWHVLHSPWVGTINQTNPCSWGRSYDHNFLRFFPIFGEKMAFFSKTNVRIKIKILHNLALFWVKNAIFFAEFFGENS
jgi:hypothetical protein